MIIVGLAYTAFMAYTGFTSDYLLVGNGVLVSTFIAHIYMIVAIFIVHHSHFMSIFIRKPKTLAAPKEPEYYDVEDGDYYEYDDYDEYEE